MPDAVKRTFTKYESQITKELDALSKAQDPEAYNSYAKKTGTINVIAVAGTENSESHGSFDAYNKKSTISSSTPDWIMPNKPLMMP